MKTPNVVGANVYKYRAAQGYTQEHLASLLGVTREQISNYEKGIRNIPVTSLNKLADLFGIELEELLEENPTITSTNLAFAFRSESFSDADIQSIAEFKRIVFNYLKMNSILNAAND
ncbi:helix-turn-helix protein [anaerobic digester metagenome]|jgi:transcriptional regulator with XRE-family HTH domain